MKRWYIFFLILIVFSTNTFSQEIDIPIRVSGTIRDKGFTVSNEIRNIIYLQERGRFPLPHLGYKIDLDAESRSKLGRSEILVVPVSDITYDKSVWEKADRKIAFQIYPMTGGKGYCYYSKDDTILSQEYKELSNKKRSFWTDPKDYFIFKNPAYNRFLFSLYGDTPLLIDQLDNDTEIKIGKIGSRFSFDTEEYVADTVYSKKKVRQLALQTLINNTAHTPFQPALKDTTKSCWSAWAQSLPQPSLPQPQFRQDLKKTPWNWMRVHTFNSKSYLQRQDNKHIYALTPNGIYIYNTETDSLKKQDPEPLLKNIKWEKNKPFKDNKVEKWLSEFDKLKFQKYIKLQNGDILIGLVYSNNCQCEMYIYKMKKGAEKPEKKLFIASYIPLVPGDTIYIRDIFEAHGKYYIIAKLDDDNNKSMTYNSWIVLEDPMFQ